MTHLNLARTYFRQEKKYSYKGTTREEKLEILQRLERTSARETKKVLRSYSSIPIEIPRDEIKPLTDNKILVKFAVDKSIEGQVVRLKGLLAHSHPDLTLGELFQKLCALGLKEWSPAKRRKRSPGTFRVAAHQECPTELQREQHQSSQDEGIQISGAALHRWIWQRDNEKCTQCGSIFALEKDHRQAKAMGGADTARNLRLLCRNCNQRAAIETFGLSKMDPYINGRQIEVHRLNSLTT